jgi:hypothetical protein
MVADPFQHRADRSVLMPCELLAGLTIDEHELDTNGSTVRPCLDCLIGDWPGRTSARRCRAPALSLLRLTWLSARAALSPSSRRRRPGMAAPLVQRRVQGQATAARRRPGGTDPRGGQVRGVQEFTAISMPVGLAWWIAGALRTETPAFSWVPVGSVGCRRRTACYMRPASWALGGHDSSSNDCRPSPRRTRLGAPAIAARWPRIWVADARPSSALPEAAQLTPPRRASAVAAPWRVALPSRPAAFTTPGRDITEDHGGR